MDPLFQFQDPTKEGSWTIWQWLALTVAAGFGLVIVVHAYSEHRASKPVFNLPDSVDDLFPTSDEDE